MQLCGIRRVAEDAGKILLRWSERQDIVASIKSDLTPVTGADREADAVIMPRLATLDPDAAYVSEESALEVGTTSVGAYSPERYWLVDPLDGTSELLTRNGEFCVAIALVEHGVVRKAVIHLPTERTTYAASRNGGAIQWHCDSESPSPLCIRRPAAVPPVCLVSRHHAEGEPEYLRRVFADIIVTPMGSAAKFCRIAGGEADLYLRLSQAMSWDVAAGSLIVEEAGGRVTDTAGNPLRFIAPARSSAGVIAFGDPSLATFWEKRFDAGVQQRQGPDSSVRHDSL